MDLLCVKINQVVLDTQKNYSQIDKEAHAIIFVVKKFYQYLYGNKFVLYTDNKQLVHILHTYKRVSCVYYNSRITLRITLTKI